MHTIFNREISGHIVQALLEPNKGGKGLNHWRVSVRYDDSYTYAYPYGEVTVRIGADSEEVMDVAVKHAREQNPRMFMTAEEREKTSPWKRRTAIKAA